MNQATLNEADPWARLALAILERAQSDAGRGDLAALAWLVGPGYDLAERLDPHGGALALLRWCYDRLNRLEAARAVGNGRKTARGFWPDLGDSLTADT